MSKFDEFKKLAEAATPGVWDIFDPKSDYHTYGVTAKNGHAVVYFGGDQEEGIRRKEDADFIAAANPVAVLNLLAIQAQLVEALKGTIALAWEDTREVKFDSTVMFGLGYDWDGWESFRMEIHTPIGAWAVWPSFGKYSVYGTHDGSMWFEKFKTREEAEEVALSQIDRICPDYPTTIARAALAAVGAQP